MVIIPYSNGLIYSSATLLQVNPLTLVNLKNLYKLFDIQTYLFEGLHFDSKTDLQFDNI